MERRTRRKFSAEFKLEAVRMLEHQSGSEVSRQLGVRAELLYKWREALKSEGAEAFRGNGNRTTLEEENRQLRLENKRLREEAEILKKATAYFAKLQK
jgi:transposase